MRQNQSQIGRPDLSEREQIMRFFAQRANSVREQVEPMSVERLEQYKDAICLMAKYIPDAVLVGGWALRLLLKGRGKFIPEMGALDIDYIIDEENYDKVRAAIEHPDDKYQYKGDPFPQEILEVLRNEDTFRRKGKKEPVPEIMGGGVRDFMKNPDTYMALEVGRYQKHVDLVVDDSLKELETATVEVDGVKVTTLTPEELFIRRLHQAKKTLNKARIRAQGGRKPAGIPEKIFQYLYLNGEIVDHRKMSRLWERRHQKDRTRSWIEETQQLIQELDLGIKQGIFTFEKIYH